jgi:hypothetical protein
MDDAGTNGDALRAERYRLSISKKSKRDHAKGTARPTGKSTSEEVEVVEIIDVLDSP